MSSKKSLLLAAFLILGLALVACQPEEVQVEVPVEVTRIVTETVTEEGQAVEVTRVVTEQMVVTATSAPMELPTSADPSTYTWMTFGDIDTLDPSLAYDTASGLALEVVMESLVTYDREDPLNYVPLLAEEVPSLENGLISEDGLTYTFNIREGVTFHNGNDLTPSDAAYSFQRGLLQSDPNGPQWLLLEPLLGFGTCYDISEAWDPECNLAGDVEGVAAADSADLVAACELVKAAVVADDAAGTLTFNLAQPWGPFISTLVGYWGSIMDQEWSIEQGAWDGSCETWQNHYAPGSENSELTSVINGTGPYMLDHWTPGEEQVYVANPNYWRDFPRWEGDTVPPFAIQTFVVRQVDEWGTRFAAMQAGDADHVTVPIESRPQADEFVGEICDAEGNCQPHPDHPDGPFRKHAGLTTVTRTDLFMNFNITVDENGQSPYIGSGQLDGNGIPPDFFSDVNVRRAMAYCFDYDTFVNDALLGEGIRNNGPIITNMLGYNPDGPNYEYDLEACAAELEQAWGGVLPETGFRFQIAYNTGNTTRQTIAEILQGSLQQINELYTVEAIGLPWPTFLRTIRAGTLPMFASGWHEDIHDPHNWVQPYTVGTYAARQNMPEELRAQFNELVNAGVATADPAAREQAYFELQQLNYEQIPTIYLFEAVGARYEQRWVDGWYFQPGSGSGIGTQITNITKD